MQTINEDNSTDFLNFTVGDVESDPATLVVTATSSNPALVPLSNIVLGGTGANRTVKLSPATNQNGSATITLSVSDGNKTASTQFGLVVSPVNDPPTISNIATQSVAGGTSTGPIAFTVADLESASSSLTVQASSSNQLLVSDENIVLGGSGANRTITITPKPGTAGTVIVTVAVSDGALSNSTSFTLLVNSSTTRTVAYTKTTLITIPDVGAASPYPSTINISGVSGNISNLTVTLMNLSHTWSRDLDGRVSSRSFGGMSVDRTLFAADKTLRAVVEHGLEVEFRLAHIDIGRIERGLRHEREAAIVEAVGMVDELRATRRYSVDQLVDGLARHIDDERIVDAAHGVPGSSLVTAMSRNGVRFGIRLSGTGEQWFEAPSPVVGGLYFPSYGPEHAAPDMGDSSITETAGLGGFAMATAPAIVQFVGGTPQDAVANTREMRHITLGRNNAFTLPAMNFSGTPAGIDARRVLDTNITPIINTGIAHKEAGVGQIGAGITRAPLECFTQAIIALASRAGVGMPGSIRSTLS